MVILALVVMAILIYIVQYQNSNLMTLLSVVLQIMNQLFLCKDIFWAICTPLMFIVAVFFVLLDYVNYDDWKNSAFRLIHGVLFDTELLLH